jgi:hypothetical protein
VGIYEWVIAFLTPCLFSVPSSGIAFLHQSCAWLSALRFMTCYGLQEIWGGQVELVAQLPSVLHLRMKVSTKSFYCLLGACLFGLRLYSISIHCKEEEEEEMLAELIKS